MQKMASNYYPQPHNQAQPHKQPSSSPSSQQPTAPASHQDPSRRARGFSFRSDKSHNSSESAAKVVLTSETHKEKEAKRLHSKADPTLAMNEAEPSAVATSVKSSLASLRNMQHKDFAGNPITDPDLSNPTRSRWERPLDTIRSFEAAVDGGYNNRKSYFHLDNESVANRNRRSTFYAGYGGRSYDGFVGSRPQSMFRPQSQHDFRQSMWQQQHRGSYIDQNEAVNSGYGYYSNGPPPPPPPQHGVRRGHPRMISDPSAMVPRQDPNVYGIPNNQRSYETVASASGSGSMGEPAGYQTDVTSSENSSVDRVQAHPTKREPDPVDDYGIGFSHSMPSTHYQLAPGPAYETGPPVPQEGHGIPRKPTADAATAAMRPTPPAGAEKRKSWLARRFSRG